MKTIREIALEERRKMGYLGETSTEVALIERVLAKYLEQPVDSIEAREFDGAKWVRLSDAVFLAPPIPAGYQFVPVEPTFECIGVIDSEGDIYPNAPESGTQIFVKKESNHAE